MKFLSWTEAAVIAQAGTPVRREAWTQWLERRIGYWMLSDTDRQFLRVVTAEDFDAGDFLAGDWTTDEIGTERDVCEITPAPAIRWIPPAVSLTGTVGEKLTLTATIGATPEPGPFLVTFHVYGVEIGAADVQSPGSASIEVSFGILTGSSWSPSEPFAFINAHVDVRSQPPLPAWMGLARWSRSFEALAFTTVDLATYFPGGGFINPPGYPYGAGTTLPAASFDRWIYSHQSAPASIDNNLEINGVRFYYEPRYFDPGAGWFNLAGPINGGQTTFLAFLPKNTPLHLNVWDAGGTYSASGQLRLYNRPI